MPVPGPRQVLVEVASVGICGSDVHYYEHGRIGDFVVECTHGARSRGLRGRRRAEGTQRDSHELGQRVALEPGVPCGSCRECRTGHYNLCRDVVFFATPPVDGALARYVTIHEDFAFGLPDHVTDDAGALCEPLSVGLWACRKAGITVGTRVAIAGAGPIGAAVALVALASGATEVIISDPVPARRARLVKTRRDVRRGHLVVEPRRRGGGRGRLHRLLGLAGCDPRRHPVRTPGGSCSASRNVPIF